MKASELADYEVLVDDDRVAVIVKKLQSEFGHKTLAESEFVTFIVPPRPHTKRTPEGLEYPGWIPEKAVFAVLTPNPRRPGQKIMSNATTNLSDWRDSEREARHYVGAPDALHNIFRAVLREHLPTITNLREMH